MGDAALVKSYSFLVSGDSISRGIVYDEAKGRYSVLATGYVEVVRRKLRGIVQNTSRFGATLIRGIGRLAKEIAKGKPDIVLIEYGGNDCDFPWKEIAANPGMPHEPQTELSLFENSLAAAVASLKGDGIVPVLMTLPPLDADRYLKWVSGEDAVAEENILSWLGSVAKIYWWHERYSSSIIAVAERTNTRWIDVRGAFLRSPDYSALVCKDGIHPNEAGHALIAETIVDYISRDSAFLLSELPR